MDNNSSTGVKFLLKEYPIEAVSFKDPICPHCGNMLTLDTRMIKGEQIRIRYICKSCNFICPIKYDNNLVETTPLYDRSIYNFMSNFGQDIHIRIHKLR